MEIARRWLTPLELGLLGAIWGGSFLFMRIAAGDFGAFPLVEIRLALGALVLLPFSWRSLLQIDARLWATITVIALINTAVPFLLYAWAAQHAPAGIVAITNSTVVLFTALFAHFLYDQRIDRSRAAGLLCGFVGIIVLAGDTSGGASAWPAVLVGTLGALMYGAGANLSGRHLIPRLPPRAIAAATLMASSLLLSPIAYLRWPGTALPPISWASAAALGLLCTGTAYLFYYRIMGRIGAPGAASVTYLIPLFGVFWAWLLLGEPLNLRIAIAGILILTGVALGQRR